eukprot:6179628-Pleurochrysis_carterae.AAC.2
MLHLHGRSRRLHLTSLHSSPAAPSTPLHAARFSSSRSEPMIPPCRLVSPDVPRIIYTAAIEEKAAHLPSRPNSLFRASILPFFPHFTCSPTIKSQSLLVENGAGLSVGIAAVHMPATVWGVPAAVAVERERASDRISDIRLCDGPQSVPTVPRPWHRHHERGAWRAQPRANRGARALFSRLERAARGSWPRRVFLSLSGRVGSGALL